MDREWRRCARQEDKDRKVAEANESSDDEEDEALVWVQAALTKARRVDKMRLIKKLTEENAKSGV